MIPISDANPTRRFPIVTVLLIVANLVVFFFVQPGFGANEEAERYFIDQAPIPCQIQDDGCPDAVRFGRGGPVLELPERTFPQFLGSILLATFMHAGFLHIGFNMLFFWVFGNNIEDYLGRVKYLIFYLLGGFASGFAQVLTHQTGDASLVPAVGASGAIAAVMGAYIVLYPRARVNVLLIVIIFFTVVQMSALVVLGIWFVLQFFTSEGSNVAWVAHVGGFVFGALGILVLGGRPQR
ncbi:MAG TPA: rhomboid family intramembrane serine protease, partial [Actinomycetota bacterium]